VTASSITDPLINPTDLQNAITLESASESGYSIAYDSHSKHWNLASKGDVFSVFLTFAICDYNSDCSGSTQACWANQCVDTSALSTVQMASICDYSSSNGTNPESPACIGWASSLAPTDPNRTTFDTGFKAYCAATYGTGGSTVKPSSGPCLCQQAASYGFEAPECFYPGCNSQSGGSYYTGQMVQNMQNCTGQCQIVVNCLNAGTCNTEGDIFCQYCGDQAATLPSCAGSNDFFKKWWPVIVGVPGGLFVLVLLFFFVRAITKKRAAQ
jgi:hypothetical protein